MITDGNFMHQVTFSSLIVKISSPRPTEFSNKSPRFMFLGLLLSFHHSIDDGPGRKSDEIWSSRLFEEILRRD